jgi:hypothetical protein
LSAVDDCENCDSIVGVLSVWLGGVRVETVLVEVPGGAVVVVVVIEGAVTMASKTIGVGIVGGLSVVDVSEVVLVERENGTTFGFWKIVVVEDVELVLLVVEELGVVEVGVVEDVEVVVDESGIVDVEVEVEVVVDESGIVDVDVEVEVEVEVVDVLVEVVVVDVSPVVPPAGENLKIRPPNRSPT